MDNMSADVFKLFVQPTQAYPIFDDIEQGKPANLQILTAKTTKCLTFFLDNCLKNGFILAAIR